jgi:hypothetical protein
MTITWIIEKYFTLESPGQNAIQGDMMADGTVVLRQSGQSVYIAPDMVADLIGALRSLTVPESTNVIR